MTRKIKFVEIPETEIINGEEVYNTGCCMADADPMVYGRLLKASKNEEAEAMLNEKGFNVLLDNGEYM